MKITYDLTEEDLYEINIFVGWTNPEKKWYRLFVVSLPFILITLFVVYDLWNKEWIYKPAVIKNITLFAVFCLAVCCYIIPKFIKSNIKDKVNKYIVANEHLNLLGIKEVEITDSGITQIGDNISGSFNWQSVMKVEETKDYLFLFVTTNNIVPLRKNIFNTVELQEVKRLISTNTHKDLIK